MMRRIQQATAIAICMAMPIATLAEDAGHKVHYDGGSLTGLKAGANLRIDFDAKRIVIFKDKKEVAAIPASAITEITYGQDVHRRVGSAVALGVFTLGAGALVALSKSKKHFIGLTWDDAGSKGGAAFQADKDSYRGLLMGIEGITGKKALDSATMGVKN